MNIGQAGSRQVVTQSRIEVPPAVPIDDAQALSRMYIVPEVFDRHLVPAVAQSVQDS
jgi:hypothetical protein